MFDFTDALSALTTCLQGGADLVALRTAAASVLSSVPADQEDLGAVAEGLVQLLATYDEGVDPDLLAAQVEGEIATLSFLATEALIPEESDPTSSTGAAEAPNPFGLPAWVDMEMVADFADAQRHALEEVEQIALEAASATEADAQRLARILHTMKGESATVGFDDLEEIFHLLEDRLDEGDVASCADLILAVKDWVQEAVPRRIAGQEPPAGHQELLRRLRGIASTAEPAIAVRSEPGAPPARTEIPPLSTDPEMVALFSEFYEESADSLVQADELLVQLEAEGPVPDRIDALFRIFHTVKGLAGFLDLVHIGDLAHASEALLDKARQDPQELTAGRLDLLLESTQMVRSLLEATRAAVEAHKQEPPTVDGYAQLLAQVRAGDRDLDVPVTVPTSEPTESAPAGEVRATKVSVVRETIKVDLRRVDALVETIGELVIMEAMVAGSTELRRVTSQRTRHQLSQLSKIVRDLQRQGLALRMVPLRGVFQKMSRLVRDLSRRSGKQIRLELEGQDAEMDRSLAERLGDPLVHMIRNAVDHGVETPAERSAAGKPAQSVVRLRAYHEGGNIIIELTDDGRGLNREAILRKARDRGLVDEGSSLPDSEVWDLIFHPGFSTAAQVTEISGRGVGMDVVKKTVESLRGRIQIASREGSGTTFRFVLPLTLAIIDGMLMAIGQGRYVLPTLAIVESIEPRVDQIHGFANGGMVLDVRGVRMPLVDLGAILGRPPKRRDEIAGGLVVVMDGLHGQFGLVVDDVIGQQQVVIKHLDEGINQQAIFSGAAILSDGQVGLILNPAALRPEKSTGAVGRRRSAEAG